MLETAAVLLVLELIGLAALPLSLRALRRLPLAGVALAKPLGLLIVAWLTWLAWSLGIPGGLGLAVAAVAVLAALGIALRAGAPLNATRAQVIACEAIFAVAFLACALFNAFAPEVWNTEKPMDMMLVNSVLASSDHPPHDAWMAGTDINYYYFGHLAAGLLIRLTGVEPTVGYNLALAAVFAMAALGTFGLAAAVAHAGARPRPWTAGAAALVLLLLAGNLRGGYEALRADGPLESFAWFQPSRVIPNTINEFPFFSFLLGDLHAHVIALPFTLVALALIVAAAAHGPPAWLRWETFTAAVTIAVLYAVNAWSWPVVAGLYLLALLPYGWRPALARWAATLALGALAILPFLTEFEPNARGMGLVDEREQLGDFLAHHAVIYGAPLWGVALLFGGRLRGAEHPWRLAVWGGAALVFGVFLLEEAGVAGAALLAVLATIALHALFTVAEQRAMWLLAAGGLICLLLPEVVHVRDEFESGELFRMNTVFKLGYQAWILLALAAGCAVAWAPALAPRFPRALWVLGLAALVTVGLAFTVVGSYARKGGFAASPSLDGRAWLARTAPGDIAAIDWLREHAAGDDVVLEAVGDDYSPFGHARISTYTGLQTPIGWEGHALQFRKDPRGRRERVRRIYETPDAATARALLRADRVRYVVIGPLERTGHGDATGVTAAGRKVFDRGGTAIYEFD